MKILDPVSPFVISPAQQNLPQTIIDEDATHSPIHMNNILAETTHFRTTSYIYYIHRDWADFIFFIYRCSRIATISKRDTNRSQQTILLWYETVVSQWIGLKQTIYKTGSSCLIIRTTFFFFVIFIRRTYKAHVAALAKGEHIFEEHRYTVYSHCLSI